MSCVGDLSRSTANYYRRVSSSASPWLLIISHYDHRHESPVSPSCWRTSSAAHCRSLRVDYSTLWRHAWRGWQESCRIVWSFHVSFRCFSPWGWWRRWIRLSVGFRRIYRMLKYLNKVNITLLMISASHACSYLSGFQLSMTRGAKFISDCVLW